MLLLASGRLVDISTNRAKLHALKNHGPASDAEHKALYPLVDVLYRLHDEQQNPKGGWTEYDYSYSGYTLESIKRADDWSAEEKAELSRWISQDTQKQLIETARRRLIDKQTQITAKYYKTPQSLYSLLVKRLENLPLYRASTQQWLSTINNMQQSGMRQEELFWSGLPMFLSHQASEQILTREQIIDAIDFTNIQLALSAEQIWGSDGGLAFKEVAQRMPHQVVYRAALKLDESCHCILRYLDDTCNYRVGVVKTLNYGHHMALNKYWFALDSYGRAITNKHNNSLYFTNSEAAKTAADEHAREFLGIHCGARFNTHYDHLTLFGGNHYREWIVSLPDHQRTFFGAHYFDHNVLAHIRTTTRRDNKGRKLLFIEEVQSDWHQNGHVYGYDTSCWGKIANAPFKKEWPALATKMMLIQASQNGFDGIAWPQGDIQETRYGKNLEAIKRRYDVAIPKTLNRLGKSFSCAVEPVKIKTRDPWLNLSRKNNKWQVSDVTGKFQTRDKYHSRDEAMLVLHRHCKSINLAVNAFIINEKLRWQIAEQGLPLFGEQLE